MDLAGIDYHVILAGNLFQQCLQTIPGWNKNYFVSLFPCKGHKLILVSTRDYPVIARTSSLPKLHDNKYWAPMAIIIVIICLSGSYDDKYFFFRYLIVTCTNLLSLFPVSTAFYKCDHGLGRYWLSRDFGRQPVPAVPGQSRVATRITLCPLQANVKDNDAQLKARGAGKKAA